MTLFRICTEDKDRENVVKLVSTVFDCFSVWQGEGYWHGQAEASLMVEIWTEDRDRELVRSTAEAIKRANGQEAVLVQEIECKGEMI